MDADLIARYDRRVPRYTSYPTAPHFSPSVGAEIYGAWLRALPSSETLSLYLHIPFCAELCWYCGCHTTVARRYAPVAAYADLLMREIALVAEHLGRRRMVTHIHWGGGSPNILSPEHLITITRAIRSHFNVSEDAEVAIEIDPRNLADEHISAFTMMGINRASLGVQDFDETVQRAINRIQTFEQTADIAKRLREAGITRLNLDLMYGLPHQTAETVVNSVEQALKLTPDRIALFGYAHVPWMKRHQALLPVDKLPGTDERLRQMLCASEAIRGAGYVAIGLDHFTRPDDPLARLQRDGRLHRNFQGYTADESSTLIGLGTSSIGTLPQGYVQNQTSTAAYRRAIAGGQLATARGVAITTEDAMRRAIIERLMCDLEVDLENIAHGFGADPQKFQPELAAIDAMVEDEIVSRSDYRITVPESARPLLRSVCAVFDSYLTDGVARHSKAV